MSGPVVLTDAQMDAIAERAAQKAVEKMTKNFYAEVGQTVIKRWLIIIGAAAVAFVVGKGWWPK